MNQPFKLIGLLSGGDVVSMTIDVNAPLYMSGGEKLTFFTFFVLDLGNH